MTFRNLLFTVFAFAWLIGNVERLMADVRVQKLTGGYAHFDRDPIGGELAGVLADGSAVHRLGQAATAGTQKPTVVLKAADLRGLSYGYHGDKLRIFSAIDRQCLLILDPAGKVPEDRIALPLVEILSIYASSVPADQMVWMLVRSPKGKSLAGVNLTTRTFLPDVLDSVSRADVSDDGRTIVVMRTSGQVEIYEVESGGALRLKTHVDNNLPNVEVIVGRHQIQAVIGDRLSMLRDFTPSRDVGQVLAVDRTKPFAYTLHRHVLLEKSISQTVFDIRAVSANSRDVVGSVVSLPSSDGIAAEEAVPLVARAYRGKWFADTDAKSQSILLAYGNRLFIVPMADLQLPDHRLLTLQNESPRSCIVGTETTFPLSASDATVPVSLTAMPDGLGIVNNVVRWTPRADQVGDHVLKLELKQGDFVRSVELPLSVTLGRVPVPESVPVAYGLACQDPRSLSLFITSPDEATLYNIDIRQPEDPESLRSILLSAPAQELLVKRYKDQSWLLVSTNDAKIVLIDTKSLQTVATFSVPKDAKCRLVASRNDSDPWAYVVVVKPVAKNQPDTGSDDAIFFIDFRPPVMQLQRLQSGQAFMLEPGGRAAWIREGSGLDWRRVWQLQAWDSPAPLFRGDGTVSIFKAENEVPEYSASGEVFQFGNWLYTSDLEEIRAVNKIDDVRRIQLPDRDMMIRVFSKFNETSVDTSRLFVELLSSDGLAKVSEPIPFQSIDASIKGTPQLQTIRVFKSVTPNEYLVYCGKTVSKVSFPELQTEVSASASGVEPASQLLNIGDNVVFRVGEENRLIVSPVTADTKVELIDGPSGAVYEDGAIRWRPEVSQVGSYKFDFKLTTGEQIQGKTIRVAALFAAHRFTQTDNIFRFDRESGLLAVKGTESNFIEVFRATKNGLEQSPVCVISPSIKVTDFTFARWGKDSEAVLCVASSDSPRLEMIHAVSGKSLEKVELPVLGVRYVNWSGNLLDDLILFCGPSAPLDNVRPHVCGLVSIRRGKSLGLFAKPRRSTDGVALVTTSDLQSEFLRWDQQPLRLPVVVSGGGDYFFVEHAPGQMPLIYCAIAETAEADTVRLSRVPGVVDATYRHARELAATRNRAPENSFIAHPDLPLAVHRGVLLEPLSDAQPPLPLGAEILTFLENQPIGASVTMVPNSREYNVSFRQFGFGQNEKTLSELGMTFDARTYLARPAVFHDARHNQLLVCHKDVADAIPLTQKLDASPGFVSGSITGPGEIRMNEESSFRILKYPRSATTEVNTLPKGAAQDGDLIRWTPTADQLGATQLSITLRNGDITSEVSLAVKVNVQVQELDQTPVVIAYSERTGYLALVTNDTDSVALRDAESGFAKQYAVTPPISGAQAVCSRPFGEKDYFVVASVGEKEVTVIDIVAKTTEKKIPLTSDCQWLAASQNPADPFVYCVDSNGNLRTLSMSTSQTSEPLLTNVTGVSVSRDGKSIQVGFKHGVDQNDPSKLFAVDWPEGRSQPLIREMVRLVPSIRSISTEAELRACPAWCPGMVASPLDLLPLGRVDSKSEIGRPARYTIPENSPRAIRIAKVDYTYAPRNPDDLKQQKLLAIQLDSVPLDSPSEKAMQPFGTIELLIEEDGKREESVVTQIISDRSRNLVLAIFNYQLLAMPIQPFLPADERLLALQLAETPEFRIGRETKVELTATADVEKVEALSLPDGMTLQNRTLIWTARSMQKGIHSAELMLTGGQQSRKLKIAIRAVTGHYDLPFDPAFMVVDDIEKHLVTVKAYEKTSTDVNESGTEIAVLDPVTGEVKVRRRIDGRVMECVVGEDCIFVACVPVNSQESVVRRLKLTDLSETANNSEIQGLRQLAVFSKMLFAVSDESLQELSTTDLKVKRQVAVSQGTVARVGKQGIWLGPYLCDDSMTPRMRATTPLPSVAPGQPGELNLAASPVALVAGAGYFESNLSGGDGPAYCLSLNQNSIYRLTAIADERSPLTIVQVRASGVSMPFTAINGAAYQGERSEAAVEIGQFVMSGSASKIGREEPQLLPICCGEKTAFVAFQNRLLTGALEELIPAEIRPKEQWPRFELQQSSFLIDGVGTTQLTHKLAIPMTAIYSLVGTTPGLSIDAANATVTLNETEVLDYAKQSLNRTLVSMTRDNEPLSGTLQKLLVQSPGLLVAPPNAVAGNKKQMYLPVTVAIKAETAGNRNATLRYGVLVGIPLEVIHKELKDLEQQTLVASVKSPKGNPTTMAPVGAAPEGTPENKGTDQSAQQKINELEKRIENMEASLKTINTQLDTLIELMKKKNQGSENR